MKKLLCFVFLSAAVLTFAAEENPALNKTAEENLALNKTVTASSTEKAIYEPKFAVDGNIKSRWSSQFNDPQWFMVDLGGVKKVGRVVIRWEKSYAKKYKIQISTDGKHWKDAVVKNDGKGNVEILKFPPQDARYVRFAGDGRVSWAGYSFWEFQVFEK